ncbi:MAG: hypothetical protein VW333_03285, partial [Pseudomonadales bacterium]
MKNVIRAPRLSIDVSRIHDERREHLALASHQSPTVFGGQLMRIGLMASVTDDPNTPFEAIIEN